MRIADKIKNARIQKGYTQEQVSENLLVVADFMSCHQTALMSCL